MNFYLVALITAFLIGLILFLIRMNRNDRKDLEKQLNQDTTHYKQEDPTDVESDNT